jgi:hypothetical protein
MKSNKSRSVRGVSEHIDTAPSLKESKVSVRGTVAGKSVRSKVKKSTKSKSKSRSISKSANKSRNTTHRPKSIMSKVSPSQFATSQNNSIVSKKIVVRNS